MSTDSTESEVPGHEVIVLSAQDARRFAEPLIEPPLVAPALVRADELRKKLVMSETGGGEQK